MKSLLHFQVANVCKRRVLCELNQKLMKLGDFKDLAIVTSIGLVQNSVDHDNTQSYMKAARTGRLSKYPCAQIFSSECSRLDWNRVRDTAELLLWKQ